MEEAVSIPALDLARVEIVAIAKALEKEALSYRDEYSSRKRVQYFVSWAFYIAILFLIILPYTDICSRSLCYRLHAVTVVLSVIVALRAGLVEKFQRRAREFDAFSNQLRFFHKIDLPDMDLVEAQELLLGFEKKMMELESKPLSL